MQKTFVKEYTIESEDEYPEKEELQVVEIFPNSHRPNEYHYIIFMGNAK
ncbi:MAG: hypothetical protein ACQET8_23110 [Bacillota bacterium]